MGKIRPGLFGLRLTHSLFCSYIMSMPDLEWEYRGAAFACDTGKREANQRKHGIDLCETSYEQLYQ